MDVHNNIYIIGYPSFFYSENIKQYSEAYQNGRDKGKVDKLTLERCFHDIASNENREQNLCSVQLNVTGLEEEFVSNTVEKVRENSLKQN